MLISFFDIQALWRSRLRTRVPECQRIKKGRLDHYGAERFGIDTFCHNQKKCGTERVKHHFHFGRLNFNNINNSILVYNKCTIVSNSNDIGYIQPNNHH